MPHRTFPLVSVALLCVAAGCNSKMYPASPVPAVLSDREAVRLADLHLDQLDQHAGESRPRDVVSIEPTDDGHLVAYHSYFDETMRPPKESRLVLVKHTGDARELTFRQGR
jgi:hypothetical protein